MTYTLFFKDAAPKIAKEIKPPFEGFWAKENNAERFIKSTPITVKGEQFRGAVIKQFRVVPLQSGKLTVAEYRLECILPQQQSHAKAFPEKRVLITAPAVIIAARALPEPIPQSFSGAVGNFTLEFIADKQRVKKGDAVALQLILKGTGSLNTTQLPALKLPESFRYNQPEKSTSRKKEESISSGSITATTTAHPQSEGTFEIPAVHLAIFSPVTGKFQTLMAKPLAITVTAPQTESVVGTDDVAKIGDEKGYPAWQWLAGIATVAVLAIATIVVRRKKRSLTKKSDVTVETTHNETSAGEMKRQLFEQLQEAGVSKPSALTRHELESALQKSNIPDELRLELFALLDMLDKMLYMPVGKKDGQIPGTIIVQVNTLMEKLKQVKRSR